MLWLSLVQPGWRKKGDNSEEGTGLQEAGTGEVGKAVKVKNTSRDCGSWVPETAQLIRVGGIQSWLLLTKQRLC